MGWGRAAAFFSAAVLLFSACGIPQYEYIYPAKADQNKGNEVFFDFTHDTENSKTIFQGYRLFYKLYSVTEFNNIESGGDFPLYIEEECIEDLSGTSIIGSGFEDLGYRILYTSTTGDYLIYIPSELRDTEIEFTVNFSDILNNNEGNPVLFYEEETIVLYRHEMNNPLYPSNYYYISFTYQDFVDGQSDLPDGLYGQPSTQNNVYFSLYVVPYGLDDDLNPTYGEARSLGYISLEFRL